MKRRPWWMAGIAIGWLVGVIAGVRGVESGMAVWKRRTETLARSQELLGRYKGWIEAGSAVTSAWEQVLGSLAHVRQKDLSWMALERVERTTQELGLTIREMRPTRLPAKGGPGQSASFRLDARLEGSADSVAAFLRRLPDEISGVRLEQLQITPLEPGKLQVLVRIFWGISLP